MLKIQYSYEIDGKRQKSASKNAFWTTRWIRIGLKSLQK